MLLKASKVVSNLLNKNVQNYGITPQVISNVSASSLLDVFPKTLKRTKTVCTIGYLIFHLDPKQNTPNKPENS